MQCCDLCRQGLFQRLRRLALVHLDELADSSLSSCSPVELSSPESVAFSSATGAAASLAATLSLHFEFRLRFFANALSAAIFESARHARAPATANG